MDGGEETGDGLFTTGPLSLGFGPTQIATPPDRDPQIATPDSDGLLTGAIWHALQTSRPLVTGIRCRPLMGGWKRAQKGKKWGQVR